MAVIAAIGNRAGAINYTFVTDTSTDWTSVANSTYFYDKADKLVHFKNASGTILEIFAVVGEFIWTFDLTEVLTYSIYAPYTMKITSVTDVLNTPTTTILDDGLAYTLGDTIAMGSLIKVTVSIASVINLNVTKL
jgi:hypothetical protein